MALYSELQIYKDIRQMSKELRRSINNMPRFDKFTIGKRILNNLTDLQIQVYYVNSRQGENKLEAMRKLKDLLVTLNILLTNCIDDKILLLTTKFSIHQPLQRLKNINAQAVKWEKYMKEKYTNNVNSESLDTNEQSSRLSSHG